jgi:SAM-dependent methyltransferase
MPEYQNKDKAALRGVPSLVWRAGQERRLMMIREAAGERARGRILIDGCGNGAYLTKLAPQAQMITGLDIEWERSREAWEKVPYTLCAAGEYLPFPDNYFDLTLSHEVLEHVQNDRLTLSEIVRTLAPGGRLVLFCPNRGYPFETHGIYWQGKYHFGNIPLVNYLPRRWRDRLAPHVNVYTSADLNRLLTGLPAKVVSHDIIFGAYDNIIARSPALGRTLRKILQSLEKTPLRFLGLSHVWVLEKI